ncbi:MAG TPA: nitroreductase family protein [Pyrinomonadaceae bacterium]|jgi:hypothetical protein
MTARMTLKDLWKISASDFPGGAPPSEKLKFLIRYAVLAPSSHNSQPWLFKISSENSIEIYADRSRWLKIADADRREMHISIGCALENLLIAARHFGFDTKTDYFPKDDDKNCIARVVLRQSEETKIHRGQDLFEFLTARSTFHQTFLNKQIGAEIRREIENCCRENEVNLYLTSDENIRERIEELIVRSDAAQFADPEFRKELAYWIEQGAFGNSWLMSQIGSLAVAYLNLGKSTAKTDCTVLRSAPVFGLITSVENKRLSQVKAGQVFERIYLTARKFGLGVRPMSQIVQIPEHKEELKKLIPQTGEFPQQPFLLGFAEVEEFHTPRRNIDEVIAE